MSEKMLVVNCDDCHGAIPFDQPYRYHAGFGNQGFLYNEAGTRTLVWSSFDRAYASVMGDKHPWMLNAGEQRRLEGVLGPSPSGDRWLFSNPPRCPQCGSQIGQPMTEDIYYYMYPGSVLTDAAAGGAGLGPLLQPSRQSG